MMVIGLAIDSLVSQKSRSIANARNLDRLRGGADCSRSTSTQAIADGLVTPRPFWGRAPAQDFATKFLLLQSACAKTRAGWMKA